MANYIDNSAIDDQFATDVGGINTRDLWRKLAAVHSRGNLAVSNRTITSNETLLPSDSVIIVDSTSNVTVTLPAANSWGSGKTPLITIVRKALTTNGTVTVAAGSGDAIYFKDNSSTGFSSVNVNTTIHLLSNGDTRWLVMEVDASIATDNENLIIGGDFSSNPWQFGTTFAAMASGTYAADRWCLFDTSAAVLTVQRSTSAPTAAAAGGYSTLHSLEVLVTTADTSIAAGDYVLIGQKIEASRLRPFGFGTAANNVMSCSFWVSSPKTGTHCVCFLNHVVNRSYIAEYTVNSANTWEYKSVSFVADGSGTWQTGDGQTGCQIFWVLAVGSSFQQSANTWTATSAFGTSNQVNCLDAINNSFKLALVDFRKGLSPTVYQYRHPDIELLLCERYSTIFVNNGTRPGIRITGYGAAAGSLVLQGYTFATTMCKAPTVLIAGTWTNTNCVTPAIGAANTRAFELYTTASAAGAVDSFPAAGEGVVVQAEL